MNDQNNWMSKSAYAWRVRAAAAETDKLALATGLTEAYQEIARLELVIEDLQDDLNTAEACEYWEDC